MNSHIFDGASYSKSRPEHDPAFFQKVLQQAGLRPGDVVVDIGAGEGHSTLPLLDLGYRVIAIENGDSMVEELKKNLAGHPNKQNVHIIHKSIEKIQSQDIEAGMRVLGGAGERADGAIAASALHWFDRTIALPKIRDTLKPGAKLIGISHIMDAGDPAAKALHAFLLAQNVPGYETAKTTFGPDRWSSVAVQAKRYLENGYTTESEPDQEKRRFDTFATFKDYLGTVSSVGKWLENIPQDDEAMQQLRRLYDTHVAPHGIQWTNIACAGTLPTGPLRDDPSPPPDQRTPGG